MNVLKEKNGIPTRIEINDQIYVLQHKDQAKRVDRLKAAHKKKIVT